MPPAPASSPEPSPLPDGGSNEAGLRREIEVMRTELAAAAQQILRATDAVVGAEAELSVAKARVAEVEHHLHVRTAEVTELQATVLRLTAELEGAGAVTDEAGRPNPLARRLSPLLARTANLAK